MGVDFCYYFHSNELNLMVYKWWHEFGVGVASSLYYIFVLLTVFVYCVAACDAGIIDSQTLRTVQVALYELLAVLFGKVGLHRGKCQYCRKMSTTSCRISLLLL